VFEVRLTRQPARYVQRAPTSVRSALSKCFEKLEMDPFRVVEPLHGPLRGKWKVRVGGLRLIMEIEVDAQRIRILYIGPRGDAY